ncbi:UDP-glucosyl transferase 71D1 [Hibiscus trionum]|uniref:Glycosyltransferase n=1 Tax=Hibiscus trionum TaxID=183268 RepID=A0A9W7MGH9_HIBTR|nr:UDP-glucosyl transferase 71D1 [Hibiscus trionum]
MKNIEIIFVPAPGMGHIVSAVEFSKRLIHRDHRIRITILFMKWFPNASVDAYIDSLVASQPDGIQVIDLPQLDLPPFDPTKSIESFFPAFVESYIPPVRDIISMKSSSDETRVAGLVLDFFCSPMIDIATDFNLPSYIFFTSNAAFLGFMLYLPDRHSLNSSEFETSDPDHLIPGFVNPVPTCVLPSPVFCKDGGYTAFLKAAERFKDAKGIIVNTFEPIEHYALNYLSNGHNPPLYPVGPVIDFNGLSYSNSDDNVMNWLDGQPQSSVVFLCFGSMGNFKAPQVKEIALGLERSGFRFLWSLRVPPPHNDASEMLPQGFLERVQGRGFICDWAPQLKVLAHKAIGGFISHCGWNSIIESLWFGVPIVTWPMYAEQQLNAFKMVEESGLAVEMRLDYRKDSDEVVMADEIKKAVGKVMDGESEVRKKVKEMAEKTRKCIMEGGSSFNSIGRLIQDMVGNN